MITRGAWCPLSMSHPRLQLWLVTCPLSVLPLIGPATVDSRLPTSGHTWGWTHPYRQHREALRLKKGLFSNQDNLYYCHFLALPCHFQLVQNVLSQLTSKLASCPAFWYPHTSIFFQSLFSSDPWFSPVLGVYVFTYK